MRGGSLRVYLLTSDLPTHEKSCKGKKKVGKKWYMSWKIFKIFSNTISIFLPNNRFLLLDEKL